jgi:hypothetical protein
VGGDEGDRVVYVDDVGFEKVVGIAMSATIMSVKKIASRL